MQNRFSAAIVVALVSAVVATPAAAMQITYTMAGTLAFVGEEDPLILNGARLVIVAIADTEVGPVFTSSISGLASATYQPAFDVAATFSNRPGGAPDVDTAYSSQLQSLNRFPPGTLRDGFMFFEAPATFDGTAVTMPAFSIFFPNQAYFAGTGTPPLPLFAPADVATLAAGFVGFSGGAYTLSDRSFSAVPEPGAALCVALGLGLLAAVRRRD